MKPFVFISPEEHFSEAIKEAMAQRQVDSVPIIETYLVQLLKHYLDSRNFHRPIQTDSTEKPPETFAEIYLHALNSEDPVKKREMMKTVGDKALYLSGFFSDSLQRKIVDIDYYAQIGSAAYSNLSNMTKEDSLAHVFSTFSKKFRNYVDVLNYISEKSWVSADQSVLTLYDRYLRTGSDLAREKLYEMGVVTVPKEHLKVSKA